MPPRDGDWDSLLLYRWEVLDAVWQNMILIMVDFRSLKPRERGVYESLALNRDRQMKANEMLG